MKSKTTKKQPATINQFVCRCDNETRDLEKMKEHLKDVHGITELKGSKSMTMHLDAKDYFVSQYEWKIGGAIFDQHIETPRAKNDPMRFA